MSLEMKMEKREVNMTEAEAWAVIEKAGVLFNTPGDLQFDLKKSPVGPVHKAKVKELLHLLVEHYDIGERAETEETLAEIRELFGDINMIEVNHMLGHINEVGVAMHFIPLGKMVTGVEPDFEKIDKNITEEQAEELRQLGGPGTSAGVAVLDPRIAKIIGVGVRAIGSQIEFGKLQAVVKQRLPKEVQDDVHSTFVNQMCGAVSEALTARSTSGMMSATTVCSVIESIICTKQALSTPTIALWDLNADQMADCVPASLHAAIKRRLKDAPGQAEEAQAELPPEAKATSTAFSGNGTLN